LEKERSGWTPLHVAVRACDVGKVRQLLSAGCNVEDEDRIGRTALHIAAHTNGTSVIVEALLDRGANVNASALLRKSVTPLHVAALCGNADVAALLLRRGAKANATDKNGFTPLHNAASEGHAQLVDLLLGGGGDINARDEDGATPLYFASKQGHLDVVKYFIRNRARVDQRDKQGNTALTVAINADHVTVARVLVDAGADVNATGQAERTPIFWTRSREAAEVLIEKGVRVNATDQWGNYALHVFAEKGNAPLIQLLLENGAAVDAVNRNGRSALHWAANAKTVEVLLNNGADANKKDGEGKTPQDLATVEGRREAAKTLSERAGKRRWWNVH
jgi:ankyrin repeat protein